jgi:hypothetical protein
MGNRVLVCLAALLLAACAKRDSGCATPATQASLAAFVNSHVRQNLRLGGYDPLDSGLVKISRIEGFEATRLDEERERSSCRAIIQFEVEGLAMPTPVEYDLLPSSGDDDSAYDTVVSMKLPLGGIGARLNNGVLKELREKESAVESLEGWVERIGKVVAADESGKYGHSPFAEQGKTHLAARQAELEQARQEVAHITESLRAGRGGR